MGKYVDNGQRKERGLSIISEPIPEGHEYLRGEEVRARVRAQITRYLETPTTLQT